MAFPLGVSRRLDRVVRVVRRGFQEVVMATIHASSDRTSGGCRPS